MGYRLLLADDSITIQKVVELVMGPEDFQIKSFNDGEKAYEAISTFKPHIILADIDMPKLNGYELCQKVKANTDTVHIPVILLAGAFEPFDEDLAKKNGADDFIIKPFESQELISKVKALVNDIPMDEEQPEPSIQEPKADEVFAGLDDISPASPEEEQEDITKDISFTPEDMALLTEKAMDDEETLEPDKSISFGETLANTLKQEPEDQTPPPIQQSQVSQPVQPVYVPQSIDLASLVTPSREDVLDLFKQTINKKIDYIINEEIKDMVIETLKEGILENLRESFTEIVEEATKVVLKSVAEQIRDRAIIVLNNAIPDLVQNLIEKEIQKITSEL
ncbi:MAG TPA: response regulator [Nitrospirae bacterium]|nr:response regulator [Nitrospirota bacterium]